MKITAQQARETKIFVISYKGNNGYVEETTLYNHVVESAEETTSPRGVMHKLFYDQVDKNESIVYELRQWQANGKAKTIDTFNTEEEAESEWFRRTYEYDFMTDDQRDTMYWNTSEEANAELNERKQHQ